MTRAQHLRPGGPGRARSGGRALVDLITDAAVHRRTDLLARNRTVYVLPPRAAAVLEPPESAATARPRRVRRPRVRRVSRVSRHSGISPLAGTMLRPVGDAVTAVQALRAP